MPHLAERVLHVMFAHLESVEEKSPTLHRRRPPQMLLAVPCCSLNGNANTDIPIRLALVLNTPAYHRAYDLMLSHLNTSHYLALVNNMQTILSSDTASTAICDNQAIGWFVMQHPSRRLRKPSPVSHCQIPKVLWCIVPRQCGWTGC